VLAGAIERLHGVLALEAHFALQTVQPSGVGRDRQRQRALVDSLHFACARARCAERKGAHERVRVEHALAARELRHARAQLTLVDVKAGFLPKLERNAKRQPALGDLEMAQAGVPANHTLTGGEAFGLGSSLRASVHDGSRP
jgi:hypothetical protein